MSHLQEKRNAFYNVLWKFIGAVVESATITFLTALIVMLLWNWLMPELFKLTRITYWQALGLEMLCSYLFKDGVSLYYVQKAIREKK